MDTPRIREPADPRDGQAQRTIQVYLYHIWGVEAREFLLGGTKNQISKRRFSGVLPGHHGKRLTKKSPCADKRECIPFIPSLVV